LAAARATFALNAALSTRRFPAIVLLLMGCLPPTELHLVKAPKNRGPPHLFHSQLTLTVLASESLELLPQGFPVNAVARLL